MESIRSSIAAPAILVSPFSVIFLIDDQQQVGVLTVPCPLLCLQKSLLQSISLLLIFSPGQCLLHGGNGLLAGYA